MPVEGHQKIFVSFKARYLLNKHQRLRTHQEGAPIIILFIIHSKVIENPPNEKLEARIIVTVFHLFLQRKALCLIKRVNIHQDIHGFLPMLL